MLWTSEAVVTGVGLDTATHSFPSLSRLRIWSCSGKVAPCSQAPVAQHKRAPATMWQRKPETFGQHRYPLERGDM